MKPRRSLNMTVASPRTPPSRTPSASARTWSTTASGTKRANASRACSRSKATVSPWIAAVGRIASDAGHERVDDGDDRAAVERELRADEQARRSPASADGDRRARSPQPQRRQRRERPPARRPAARSPTRARGAAGSRPAPWRSASAWISGPGISSSPRRRGRVQVLQRLGAEAPTTTILPRTSAGSNAPFSTSAKLSVAERPAAAREVDPGVVAAAAGRSAGPSICSRRGDRRTCRARRSRTASGGSGRRSSRGVVGVRRASPWLYSSPSPPPKIGVSPSSLDLGRGQHDLRRRRARRPRSARCRPRRRSLLRSVNWTS